MEEGVHSVRKFCRPKVCSVLTRKPRRASTFTIHTWICVSILQIYSFCATVTTYTALDKSKQSFYFPCTNKLINFALFFETVLACFFTYTPGLIAITNASTHNSIPITTTFLGGKMIITPVTSMYL